jgi:hypothetical protein
MEKEERMKKKFYGNFRVNFWVMEVQEDLGNAEEVEILFKNKITENFPNLEKDTYTGTGRPKVISHI